MVLLHWWHLQRQHRQRWKAVANVIRIYTHL